MAKRKSSKQADEALIEIATIIKGPYSKEADKVLDVIVQRYIRVAHDFMKQAHIPLDGQGATWMRLLQIRFIVLMCEDCHNVRRAVEIATADAARPPIRDLMKELIRQAFIETKNWDLSKGAPPTQPHLYWKKAVGSLNEDIERWNRDARTALNTSNHSFLILGADYSLDAVEE